MVDRSPEELAEDAKGNINPKHLSSTGGILRTHLYDRPLIEYLRDDEQPHYLFKNAHAELKRIKGESGRVLYKDSAGHQYLLITNQRILYVAGRRNGDQVIDHQYVEILNTQVAETEIEDPTLEFSTIDDVTYQFKLKDTDEVDGSISYIDSKIPDSNKNYASKADFQESLRDRYEQLADRDKQDPQRASETVDAKLEQVEQALTEDSIYEANQLLGEVERLAGPSVKHLLTEARNRVDEAQTAVDNGNLDTAVKKWETAENEYEEALEKAEQTDDPLAESIEEGLSSVQRKRASTVAQRNKKAIEKKRANAHQTVDTAHTAKESDNFERAIKKLETAKTQYEQILNQAEDVGESLTRSIQADLSAVQEELESLVDKKHNKKIEQQIVQAQQTVTAAKAATDDDDFDRAIENFQSAEETYQEALDQVREVDSSLSVQSIRKGLLSVRQQLESTQTAKAEAELQQELATAWQVINSGDSLFEKHPHDMDKVRDKYNEARSIYDECIERIEQHDLSTKTDLIKQIRTLLKAATEDCQALDTVREIQEGIRKLNAGDHQQAADTLSNVSAQSETSWEETNELSKVTYWARGLNGIYLQVEKIEQAESLFSDKNYVESENLLSEVRDDLDTVEQSIRDSPYPELEDQLRKYITKLLSCCDDHQSAINTVLTSIDAQPSLTPVETFEKPPEPDSDSVPSESELELSVPVVARVRETVLSGVYSRYNRIYALVNTAQQSSIRRWIDNDMTQQVTEMGKTLDPVNKAEPVTLQSEVESIQSTVITMLTNMIAMMEQELDEQLSLLDTTETPPDFYERPAAADKWYAESLYGIADIKEFEQRWTVAVDELIEALSSIADQVSVMKNYEDVAAQISDQMDIDGEVRGAELRIKNSQIYLKLYHLKNPGIEFNREQNMLIDTNMTSRS